MTLATRGGPSQKWPGMLSAIGRLDRVHLALVSPDYDPQVH